MRVWYKGYYLWLPTKGYEFDSRHPLQMMNQFKDKDLRFARSKAELWRTYLTAVQLIVATATLVIVLIK